jgi:hypothetical protein
MASSCDYYGADGRLPCLAILVTCPPSRKCYPGGDEPLNPQPSLLLHPPAGAEFAAFHQDWLAAMRPGLREGTFYLVLLIRAATIIEQVFLC